MTTIQKIIKIGSSRGVTLPAKDLKRLNIAVGDEVEVIVRSQRPNGNDTLATASAILDRYEDDFKNLANR